jgi:hypothetical protein
MSPLAHAQEHAPVKFRCVVQDVRVQSAHVHVQCANKGLTGVYEFAAETDQPYSKRVSSAALTAQRARGSVMITYAPSLDLNPDGCDPRTCRKVIDAGPFPPLALVQKPAPVASPANDAAPVGSPAAAAAREPVRLPQSPDDTIPQHTGEQQPAPHLKRTDPPPPFRMEPIKD